MCPKKGYHNLPQITYMHQNPHPQTKKYPRMDPPPWGCKKHVWSVTRPMLLPHLPTLNMGVTTMQESHNPPKRRPKITGKKNRTWGRPERSYYQKHIT